jgi:hypothetical protein
VQLIIASHEGRLDWLIPVRAGRMAASPYGFLRRRGGGDGGGCRTAVVYRHHPGDLR